MVAHLAVAPQARGHGVASALIRELSARYPDRRGIRARCRRAFLPNQVWPSLGFIPQGNLPGPGRSGSTADPMVARSWTWRSSVLGRARRQGPCPAGHQRLHRPEPDDRRSARPDDTRPFRASRRPGGTPRRSRDNPGDQHRREPCVQEDTWTRANNDYPSLGLSDATIRDVARALEADLVRPPKTPRDVSDLRIVAAAVAADIPILVTRDRRARDRLAKSAYAAGRLW